MGGALRAEARAKSLVALIALACVLCLGALVGCGAAPQPQDDTEMTVDTSNQPMDAEFEVEYVIDYSPLEEQVSGIISEYASGSEVAVTFVGLGDNPGRFEINGSEPMASASMIKMAVLAELFAEVQAGTVSLDDPITVSSVDVVGGAGTGIYSGQTLTVRELANRMISDSDNTASNALVSLLGMDNINENAARLGLDQVLLDHKFMSTSITQDNLISSNDLASIFEWIAEGELGSPELDEMASEFLIQQYDDEALSVGVLYPWTLGHKTGSLTYARNDGGILYDASGDAACVLVVLTNDMGEGTANSMMARIATVVCNYMDALE